MFKLFKSRKAQIRGIDFSLSIIIFSLTIGQILLLTNTFIDGNRSQVDFDERLEFAESLSSQLVFNTGYGQGTENWGATPSSILNVDPNWTFGLSTAGSVDPYKLGRLSNNSISDFEIDYLLAQKGLNLSKDFRLEVSKPIDVRITNTTSDGSNDFIQVDGFVSKSSFPLFDAKIWIYIVNSSGNIEQNYTTTNSNGIFSARVNTIHVPDSYYNVGVIARYGLSSEDVAYKIHEFGTPIKILTRTKISILSSINVGNGFNVNVTTEMAEDTIPELIALYPGSPGGKNSSTAVLGRAGTNLWYNDTIAIPPTGSVLFIAIKSNATHTSVAYVDFPVSLDGLISESVQPTKIPTADSSSRFISITVRGLLVNLVITIWE